MRDVTVREAEKLAEMEINESIRFFGTAKVVDYGFFLENSENIRRFWNGELNEIESTYP